MPDYRLNRRTAERIVDLFLAGARRQKRTDGLLKIQSKQTHETKNHHCSGDRAGLVAELAGIKTWQIRKLIAAGRHMRRRRKPCPRPLRTRRNGRTRSTVIGSIAAVQGVTVTPEIAGAVREIAFESGAVVAKGDLLVRLDTSSEEAQLRAAEAQVELARLNAVRARQLRANNTVSESELDNAEATLKQNQANADTIRATIDKKTIRAPFAGQLGIRLVNLGEYLDMGKPIVSFQSLSPVYRGFFLASAGTGAANGAAVRVSTDTYPDQQFEGVLTAINPELDPTTRSVGCRPRSTMRSSCCGRACSCGRGGLSGGADGAGGSGDGYLERAVRRFSLRHRAEAAPKTAESRQVVRQKFVRTGRARGRFCQRANRPQGGRPRGQRGRVQTPQRHGGAWKTTTSPPNPPRLRIRRTGDSSASRMKSFTDLFIKRPVLALVVNLVIFIAGFQAIRSLNVRQYPHSENAAVTVTTVYVGASAELVRGFVTAPLERAIAAADGIDYIQSSSELGLSTITARLKLNYDANKALSEISSKVDQVRNDLPPEAEVPIINIESADSQFASAYLSFTSDILRPTRSPIISFASCSRGCPRSKACSGRTSWAGARSPCASGSSPTGWRR